MYSNLPLTAAEQNFHKKAGLASANFAGRLL
jgi:hypothetical protein